MDAGAGAHASDAPGPGLLRLPVPVLTYVLPLIVALGVTPEWRSWDTAQFNQVALQLGGPLLMLSMTMAAQISSVGVFNGELLIISRMPYAMARDGVLPAGLARLHPVFKTPARILVLQAVVLALPAYVLQFASPVVLRMKRPDLRGPFRIPGGLPYALFTVTLRHLLIGLGFAAVGPILFIVLRRLGSGTSIRP